jgi:integrase
LTWADIDVQNNTITINDPEKNGTARRVQVSPKLIGMINRLPKKSKLWIFGESPSKIADSLRATFHTQRKALAFKLGNPRLLQIHLHTFRHWKATTEYARTKDILHVMRLLGHRKIDNTLIYTQLVNFESNEYHSKVAKDVNEARQLIEVGFEYICDFQGTMIFRKRK